MYMLIHCHQHLTEVKSCNSFLLMYIVVYTKLKTTKMWTVYCNIYSKKYHSIESNKIVESEKWFTWKQSVFQLGIENGGVRLWKRGTSALKNYEKGQYSYFQLLNIKNVFQHYIFSSLHQIQCIYMTHCLYICYYICTEMQLKSEDQ